MARSLNHDVCTLYCEHSANPDGCAVSRAYLAANPSHPDVIAHLSPAPRKCRDCGHVEGSEALNPVTALLGAKPCKGREWRGHDWGQE
jgi:hypothetical protein